MFCKKCGNEVSDTMKFCPVCGDEIKSDSASDITKERSGKIIREFRGKSHAGVIAINVIVGAVFLVLLLSLLSLSEYDLYRLGRSKMQENGMEIFCFVLVIMAILNIVRVYLVGKCKVVIFEDRVFISTVSGRGINAGLVTKTFELSISAIDQIYKEGVNMVLVSKGVPYPVAGIKQTDEMIETLQSMVKPI